MILPQKVQKFLEPLHGAGMLVFLAILKFACWALFALASVVLLRESVRLYGLGDTEGIQSLLITYSVFSIVYLIVTWFLRMTDWPNLYYKIADNIYRKYLSILMTLDGNYLEQIGTGKCIAILSSGEKAWVEGLTNIIKEGTRIIIVMGFILYLFFHANFLYGALFIIVLFVLHGIVLYADRIAHHHRRQRTEKSTEHTRHIVRIIMSRSEILQSGKIQEEIEKNSRLTWEIGDTNRGINSALFLIFNSVRVFIILLKVSLLTFLIYAGTSSMISPHDLAGLLGLFLVFEGFLYDFVEFYKNFTKEFSDIEKVWTTFDAAPRLQGYSTGSDFIPHDSPIEIQNITYGYNDTKVFENFSLTIEKGKKTALVGASGGGKTTLMKLIAGYLHPESGSISVLGNTLSETALKSYYPHIGYLTQDPSVFDATIRENLLSAVNSSDQLSGESYQIGNNKNKKTNKIKHHSDTGSLLPDNSDILTQALRLAQCDFVFELEKGLDTEIGERGVRLSGGQKQRLAIAKIFLKNPEIILLDEPTSALDSFSEEKITEALNTLFQGRTVIIIAHRLQTVKHADDIIVIEGGEVVERGNHTELVAKNGIYHKMLELQSGF